MYGYGWMIETSKVRTWHDPVLEMTPVEWPASFTHHATPEEPSYAHQTPVALLGFQGRGLDESVQPDFCHDLFLKALIFQWS